MYKKIVEEVPSLKKGRVWCLECGDTQKVDSARCLANGWPQCCGYTMTIDDPTSQPLKLKDRRLE